MFTVTIPITEITDLVLNNARLLTQSSQISQILLVNTSSSFLELDRPIPKVEIAQLYNIDVYKAISRAIDEIASQENIILLDSNIQVNKKFVSTLTRHYALNHLYAFKVNDIFPNNTVTVDIRVGNKLTPDMFNIGAVAFQKPDAKAVNYFNSGDLIDFAERMSSNGVTLKLLPQVLCHRVMESKTTVMINKKPIPSKKTPMDAKAREAKQQEEELLKKNVVFYKVEMPEQNKDTTYDIIIPFMPNGDRFEIFKDVVECLYTHIKYHPNIQIVVHETSPKRIIDDEFIEKYSIKYVYTKYDGIFDIAWNYNYLCKNYLTSDVFVFYDADLIVDWRWIKKLLYSDKDKCYIGWGSIRYLTKDGYTKYKEGGAWRKVRVKRILEYEPRVSVGGINIIPRSVFMRVKGWPEDYSGLGYGCVDCSMTWKLTEIEGITNFDCVIYHIPHQHKTIGNDSRMVMKKIHNSYNKEEWLEYIERIEEWGLDLPRYRRK